MMNAHEIIGMNANLLVTRHRNGVIWVSGAYTEPTLGPVVWVSLIFASQQKQCASRVALVTLN